MSSDQVITLVAFAFYLVLMVAIGVFYSKRTKNNEDYFLGGRNLGGWTAALSAQASDMSGWLLMGLPGAAQLVPCFFTSEKIHHCCGQLADNSQLF